jgi:hypothetical protein
LFGEVSAEGAQMSETADAKENQAKVAFMSDRRKVYILYQCIFWPSVVALICSFGLAYYGYAHPSCINLKDTQMIEWPTYRKWEAVVLAAWIVIPPLFFWIEYFGIYRKSRNYQYKAPQPPDWEMFKYSQDVSAKVWIAVTTVLLVLYFGKDIRL